MFPLKTLKEELVILGLLQPITQREQMLFIVSNVICICVCTTYFISVMWFIVFDAQTFAEYAECSFFLLSASIISAWYSIIFWKREQYSDLLALIEVTVNKRCKKNEITENIYRKANETVEKMTKNINFFCLRILTTCNLTVPLVICFVKYYLSKDFNESFKLWYKASYPFDVHTPFGFGMGYAIQLCTCYLAVIIFSLQMYTTGGFVWFVSAFTLDINMSLNLLNVEIEAIKTTKLTTEQRIEINKMIIEIIRFHSEAKDLTETISELINGNIVMYMIYSVTCFCGSFLQEITFFENGNYSAMVNMFAPAVAPMVWLYLFCHTGTFLSDCFSNISVKLYEINWYMFPLDNMRIWPFVVAAGQKDVSLRGFGSSSCNRQLFMKIMQTTLSYFAVLHSFDYK